MYESKPYYYGTGRRKHSVARVRVYPGSGVITVNGRGIDDYFGLETLKLIVRQPLALTGTTEKFDIVCTVAGGGVTGQAGAIRHGLSRALLQYSDELRPVLKKAGFLTRDPRMKERKKYGLKAARRSPLVLLGLEGKYDVVVRVSGGGVSGQAGAIRHGLSRALLQQSDENRAVLKKAGFLTRDPRMKERKKYGLKAARRAPQFSKR